MKTPPRMKSAALLVGGVVALAGCVTPPKTEPQVQTIADETVGRRATATPKTQARWWEQYGDPQFDQLVTAALERNPTLQETLARVRAAQSQVELASAQRKPSYRL